MKRPDVFTYQDHLAFLKDWLAYLKGSLRSEFSFRKLAEEADIAVGLLPMVLHGKRKLSLDITDKLLPFLRLTLTEQEYFENLVRLSLRKKGSRSRAFNEMARSRAYQKRNPEAVEFFTFMGNWHYVTIREMANLPDFKPDPDWIRPRIRPTLPRREIEKALSFLFKHGYLKEEKNGTVSPPKDALRCSGPIYNGALKQYHQQMFSVAADSIEEVDGKERYVTGYTFSLRLDQLQKLRKILSHALDEIEGLEKETVGSKEAVYQVELAAFPLTKGNPDEK